ncbi:MAG: tail fiber domain-containing protein, partial [bacterium]
MTPTGSPGNPGPAGFQGPVGPPGPQGAPRSSPTSPNLGFPGFQGAGGGGFGTLSFYATAAAGWGPGFPNTIIVSNTVPAGSFYSNGAVTQNYSDKRLKTNIAPIDNAIAKITALRGVEYNWNPLGREFGWQSKMREVGLIAQDVQKVL